MPGNDVSDYHGLRRMTLTVDEALTGSWRADIDGVDLVVVTDPPRERWADLRAAGFRLKPQWVTWGRPAGAREADFFAELSKSERRNLRDSRRHVEEQRLTVEVHATLGPELFAEFLSVYDAQIAAMPHGLPSAHAVPTTEAGLADFYFVSARSGTELVAGVVCKVVPREDAMRVAFSAARPRVRNAMITRALYLAAFQEARRRGIGWISLGTDPTLYGHIAQAGLFTFKSRLGFVPVPLHHLDPDDDGCDEAEMVLDTARLRDPVLSLAYAEPPDRLASWADPLPMRLDVLSPANGLDLRPYRAPFVADIAFVGVPARETVVIVDPVSTGMYLAPAFRGRGRRCVAVLSGTVGDEYAGTLRRDNFEAVLTAAGDSLEAVDELTIRLASWHPSQVIAGSEWGVNLADSLTARLGVPGNLPLPGRPRRDKPAMMRAVAEAGLRVPVGARVTSVDEVDDWLQATGRLPVVVKPVASAGSEGVYFCPDADEARAATAKLLGATNVMGQPNDAVLVQERLVGQQYFVNSVSLDGRHHIHEIWRDDRLVIEGRPVYDRQVLLDNAGDVQDLLVPFVLGVLDALGVRNGPAHTELLVDERGPVLIECGARLEGAVTPDGPERATGDSQLSLTVERYTEPDRFAQRIGSGYVRRRPLAVVCLVVPRDGVVANGAARRLAELPSVICGSALQLAPGTTVHRTVDMFTSPGHLYLVADDPEQVERDYAQIRAMEADTLYEAPGS